MNRLGSNVGQDDDQRLSGRFTVTHALVAGTGYLWAPVVVALCGALCAVGVSRNWPEGAPSCTTVEAKANFRASARERDVVVGTAAPLHLGATTQVWGATAANQTSGPAMAACRCTQPLLYPRAS